MIRYASVCSGVEAASLAWEPLGWKPVWFSEIEPFPCAVLKERYPEVPNLGDMTRIKGENYRGMVDLLVGGTPCQGFSTAGKQGGLNDERSVLCLSFLNLVRTMRPRWFVWENVPGVFSTNGGEDFKAFLRAIDEIGYSCAFRVLDAQYVRVDGYPRAVPQRRRRVFVVGHLGADWRYPAAVLFEPDRLQGDSPPRRVKGKGFTSYAQRSVGETGRLWDESGVNPTLNQCSSGSIGASDRELFSQNFNGLVMNQNQVAATLDTHYADKQGLENQHVNAGCPNFIIESARSIGNNPLVQECYVKTARPRFKGGCETYADTGVAPTVNTFDQGDKRANELVVEYGAVAIAENIIGRSVENGGNGVGAQEDLAYTQNATGVMGVASNLTVRRLTPVECERLMGFPDNWTRIPWKGKPAEECPDSPRYKACGNSMCVNVMRWLGRRIERVERYKK